MSIDKTINAPFFEDRYGEDPRCPPLDPIHEAALTVASELSLPKVLQKIVHLARDLARARYSALGVPGPTGELERFLVSGLTEEEIARIGRWPTGRGLLGETMKSHRSIRLRDLNQHPRSVGFPEHHPPMTNFLGVPIISRGDTIGLLYLTNKIGAEEFSLGDQRAVELLAAYAAVAMENANLYQQVQRLAVLEERERIGMDLHDGIIQAIYAVGLTLEHGALTLDEEPREARELIQSAIDGLNRTISDIRNYILDLRPQRMRPDDLVGSLRRIVEEFRANSLVDIALDVPVDVGDDLGEATSTALFLIAQEALANATKHASATSLSVRVRRLDGRHVALTVKDNGVGFDSEGTEAVIGHGLSNMQLRANAVGGRLHIRSEPGMGTTVTATLPILQPRPSPPSR
jgi:signal transduction histidine kinase